MDDYKEDRISPQKIEEELKIVPPPADIKSVSIPHPTEEIPSKFQHAKYKTFKEHLENIRRKRRKEK